MTRALQIAVLAACLVLLVLPTANMTWPFYVERPIEGALAERKRPDLGVRGLFDETYQKQFTGWYEQHYGIRATASRLDNSFNFYVLHETRPDKHVKVGRHDVLFLDEQIWFYGRRDDARPASDAFAKVARAVQTALAEQGKELLVLVLPSKSTFYADDFPTRWTLDLGTPRPCQTLVYQPFVDALERENVRFVDGRKLLVKELAGQRDVAYSATGRHLNAPATCLVLEKGLELLRERFAIAPLDCRYERVLLPTNAEEEFDLLRLLNVWDDNPKQTIPQMATVAEHLPAKDRPDTLVVGSSFSWRVIKEAERNHAFGKIALFYYNKTVALRDGSPFYPVPTAGSPEWRSLVFDKQLIILPLPEEYLPFHNADFLLELAEALGLDVEAFKKPLTR